MTTKFRVLIICLCLPFAIFAQENFQKGTIITLNQERMEGEIDYRNWNITPDKITFRKGGNETKYTPKEIQGFEVARSANATEIYHSKTLEIDTSSQELGAFSYSPVPESKSVHVFARVFLQGKISLYFYRDKTERRHYVAEKDGVLTTLEYRKYSKTVKNSSTTKFYNYTSEILFYTSEKYKAQLGALTADCGNMPTIHKLTYSNKSIVGFLKKYHECKGSSIEFIEKRERTKPDFIVSIGYSLNRTKFKGYHPKIYKYGDSHSSGGMQVGFGIDSYVTRARKKISLYNELQLKTYQFKGAAGNYTAKLDLYSTRLNNMLRYHIPLKQAKIMLSAGISQGFVFEGENTEHLSSLGGRTSKLILVSRYEQGIVGAIGFSYNKFGLDIRYEQNRGYSPYKTFAAKIRSLQFIATYKINK